MAGNRKRQRNTDRQCPHGRTLCPHGREPSGTVPTPSPSRSQPALCTGRSRRGAAAAETTPLTQPLRALFREAQKGSPRPRISLPWNPSGPPRASALYRDGKCLPRGSCPWGWASSCKWLLCPDLRLPELMSQLSPCFAQSFLLHMFCCFT